MSSDWHESEAKAECIDLRLRVRQLEAEVDRQAETHAIETMELLKHRNALQKELTEAREGWRQGVMQQKINMLPETEAAVHIAELEDYRDSLLRKYRALEAENRRLRNICDRDAATANRLFPENIALKAENARLQAIIDDAYAKHVL